MDSLTKNRQPEDVILRLVEHAFGPRLVPAVPGAISEFTNGWFSATYRVTLADSRDVVLKVAPSPGTAVLAYEREMMRNELEAMRLIRLRTSVPVPEILFADDSRQLCDGHWFFMSLVPGESLGPLWGSDRLSASERDAYGASIGAINRRLNAIAGRGFGSVADPRHAAWSDAFAALVDDVLDDAVRAGLDLHPLDERIRALVARSRPLLDEVREPRFVEWDLWPSNVIVRDGAIAGIVDHERALFGDPLMEAGLLGLDLPMLGDAEPFMRGYGIAGLDRSARRRRRLYTAHLLLVMTVEPRFRGPQDPNQAEWARERLAEVLERLEAS